MDDRRLDALARYFATASSRRAAMAGLLAALVPVVGTGAAKDRERGGDLFSEACVPDGRRCGRGSGRRRGRRSKRRRKPCRKCCSRYSIRQRNGRRRCACKPDGARAGNRAQCCTGSRDTTGRCGVCGGGLSRCRAGCVDLQSDAVNCGLCGDGCGAGEACRGGECVPCGGAGQPCCPDGSCAADRVCQPDGTCALPAGTCDAGQPLCGQQATQCNGVSFCRCGTSVAGEVFCRATATCTGACDSDDDCPGNEICIESCQGGSTITCCASPCPD